MTIALSSRLRHVKPSATLALGARVNQLKAAGKDIINLTVGEPDFDTPEHIKDAAIRAIRDGFTKYTAVDGTPGLKRAIVQKFATENKLNYEPSQIIVSNGTKQEIYNLMQALLNPGDEVIIPAPYWVSYPDMAYLAGATPTFLPTCIDQHFKISPEQLAKAIKPNTRLLILNSPSNPTGIAYTKTELERLAEVLLKHPQVWIASDDMYEHILWTAEPFVNIVNACPELYSRTIVCNGVSKSYAMTGWRIGFAAGDKELIAAMASIQSQSTSNPNSIAQIAAQAALESDQQCVREMCKAYRQRHEIVFSALKTMSLIKCLPGDGTFYLFPCMQPLIEEMSHITSDIALSDYLLEEVGVALMPGTPFGGPGCMRLSFAASPDALKQAIQRLQPIFATTKR